MPTTWDDTPFSEGDEIPPEYWNNHVDDQKGHSGRHESGGSDELDVDGLSGVLADDQPPQTEAVEDIVSVLLNDGTNITTTYDDANDVLTVDTSALNNEEVEDAVASLITTDSNLAVSYHDPNDTLTISLANNVAVDGLTVNGTTTTDALNAKEAGVTNRPQIQKGNYGLHRPPNVKQKLLEKVGSTVSPTSSPKDALFNPDGSKLYLSSAGEDLLQLSLTNRYDPTDGKNQEATLTLPDSDRRVRGIDFNADGTKLYISTLNNTTADADFYSYNLQTAYDIDNATLDQQVTLTSIKNHGLGIKWVKNGSEAIIAEGIDDNIHRFKASTNYDLSSLSLESTFNPEANGAHKDKIKGFSTSLNGESYALIVADGTARAQILYYQMPEPGLVSESAFVGEQLSDQEGLRGVEMVPGSGKIVGINSGADEIATYEARNKQNDRIKAADTLGETPDARLTRALDQAITGSVIYLENAEYTNSRTINKQVTMIGTSPGTQEDTTINANWTIDANKFNIHKVNFEGNTITFNGGRGTVQNVAFGSVSVSGNRFGAYNSLNIDVTFNSGAVDGVADGLRGGSTAVDNDGGNLIGDII